VYETRYIELTPEQKRIYKDICRQALAVVEPGIVSVTTALTAMLRLHQVTLGYVKSDAGELVPIASNRLYSLMDMLDDVPGKTIIFCRFKEDIRQIVAKLPVDSHVSYHGDISPGDRTLAVHRFQTDPVVNYFIATDAAARGLTLTAAENVIYYSQGFSLETRLQSEDRPHRIGQTKTVTYTDFVAQGTVDEKVIAALHLKAVLADSVLNREQLVEMLTLKD
jgi:SNF2 family DNA or RNA helicase